MHDEPEEIRRDTAYTSAALKRRLRLGDATWRKMKKEGLRTARLGKTVVVLGDDFFQYVAEHEEGGDR